MDPTSTHSSTDTRVDHADVRRVVCLTRAPRHTFSRIHTSIYTDGDISPTHINTGTLGQCPPELQCMAVLFPAAHKASCLAAGTMSGVRTGFVTAWIWGFQRPS